jgi:hypothetical protein
MKNLDHTQQDEDELLAVSRKIRNGDHLEIVVKSLTRPGTYLTRVGTVESKKRNHFTLIGMFDIEIPGFKAIPACVARQSWIDFDFNPGSWNWDIVSVRKSA